MTLLLFYTQIYLHNHRFGWFIFILERIIVTRIGSQDNEFMVCYVEKHMATHSSILAWRILWTEEPGGLLSMGSHRVGHS